MPPTRENTKQKLCKIEESAEESYASSLEEADDESVMVETNQWGRDEDNQEGRNIEEFSLDNNDSIRSVSSSGKNCKGST